MGFTTDELKHATLFPNPEKAEKLVKSGAFTTPEKIKAVLGEFTFPEPGERRPYLYGCMVLSFDGKMGFSDNPEGTLISKQNRFDPRGAKTDFWILNVCRCYADAVIMGTGTLRARMSKLWYAEISDADLLEARKTLGKKSLIPPSIIASADGKDIPFEHPVFSMTPAPLIMTSEEGAEYIKKRMKREIRFVTEAENLYEESDVIRVLISGDKIADTAGLMKLLRDCGVKYASVEAPGYIWNLIHSGFLDEYLLNYSGVMAGGNVGIGMGLPFSYEAHPHAELLSVGFTKGFLFTRQKLIYD